MLLIRSTCSAAAATVRLTLSVLAWPDESKMSVLFSVLKPEAFTSSL